MIFQRENQRVSASEILQSIASGEQIKLHKCTITGGLDINRLLDEHENFENMKIKIEASGEKTSMIISEPVEFNTCVFEDIVFFAPPWDKSVRVEVVFEQDAIFNSSVFKDQARFEGAKFSKQAGFDGCTFERIAVFREALFDGITMFRTTLFEGYGLFHEAVFKTTTSFMNTCFTKGANFTEVKFFGRTDFSGVYAKSKSVPVYESVWFARRKYGEDETFWRFIKQASQEAGYYQLAGESFYNERCSHLCHKFYGYDFENLSVIRKAGRLVNGIKLLPEFVLGRLLFGYGERPVRVLFASVLVILACAFYFSSPLAIVFDRLDSDVRAASELNQLDFMDGLYFSTITFTTLGFGDMYPAPTHFATRCVAMLEALSGACLMALFVVGLSKRYSRG